MFQSEAVVEVATVTKLTRNLFIIAIIPIVSYLFYQKGHEGADEKTELPKWYTFIPLFVIGFLLLLVVRTIGDATMESAGSAFDFLAPAAWEQVYAGLSSFGTTICLAWPWPESACPRTSKCLKG